MDLMDLSVAYMLIERNKNKKKTDEELILYTEKIDTDNLIRDSCVNCGQYPIWCQCYLKHKTYKPYKKQKKNSIS